MGHHRQERPRRRRWILVAAALAVSAGLGAYLVTVDGHGEEARAVATPLEADLPSRDTDPRPLTVDEVFAGHPVVKAEALTDCAAAMTGELEYLVREGGCSQTVRGTFTVREFVVTAGLVNLVDSAAARDVHEQIRSLVDAREGGFRGLAAGAGTAPVARPGTQFGWHVRGHYLAYAVIARRDGQPVAADDPAAAEVLRDVVETHLRGTVLDRRVAANR